MKKAYLIVQGNFDDYHVKEVWTNTNKERVEERARFLNLNLSEWEDPYLVEERTANPATGREVYKNLKGFAVYFIQDGRAGTFRGGVKDYKAGEIHTLDYSDTNVHIETLPEKNYTLDYYDDRVVIRSFVSEAHAKNVAIELSHEVYSRTGHLTGDLK